MLTFITLKYLVYFMTSKFSINICILFFGLSVFFERGISTGCYWNYAVKKKIYRNNHIFGWNLSFFHYFQFISVQIIAYDPSFMRGILRKERSCKLKLVWRSCTLAGGARTRPFCRGSHLDPRSACISCCDVSAQKLLRDFRIRRC